MATEHSFSLCMAAISGGRCHFCMKVASASPIAPKYSIRKFFNLVRKRMFEPMSNQRINVLIS